MSILKKGFSTFDIKVLGIILMVIDHIHQMFPNQVPVWVDYFGRPVATLFFFVSVVGFYHTHSKKKYMFRLYMGLILMNIGNLIVNKLFPSDNVLINNIFSDLLLGTLLMTGVDCFINFKDNKKVTSIIKGILYFVSPLILSIPVFLILNNLNSATPYMMSVAQTFIPSLLTSENNVLIYMIPLLYIFKNSKNIQIAIITIISLAFLFSGNVQWIMLFSIIPIYLYNGNKGKSMKNFFYFFYPIHIWILYLIAYFV